MNSIKNSCSVYPETFSTVVHLVSFSLYCNMLKNVELDCGEKRTFKLS